MLTRLRSAAILVSDQAAALDFYVGTLGFEKRIDYDMGPDMRFLTIGLPGDPTEVVLGTATLNGTESIKNSLTFVVDDIDATYAELTAKGVRFTQEPEEFPWGGKGSWILDLDDNKHFLCTEPAQS